MKILKIILKCNFLYYTLLLIFLFILTLNNIIFLPMLFLYYFIFKRELNYYLCIVLFLLIAVLFIKAKNYQLEDEIKSKVLITDKYEYFNKYTYTIKHKNKKYIFNASNNFNVGSYIYLNAKIIPFKDLSSPNAFKETKYYLEKGIYAKLEIKNIELLNDTNYFYFLNNKIINSNLNYYLKTQPNNVNESVNNLNLFYLLSLSGIHIYYLINIIKKIMFHLDIKNVYQDIIIIILIFFIITLSGFYYSVIRLSIYIFLKYIKKYFYQNITNYSLMNLSYLINIFIFPYLLFSQSYLISYILVSFIFIFKGKLYSESYFYTNIKLSFLVNLVLLPFNNQLNIISIILNPIFIFIFVKIIFPLEIIIYLFNLNIANNLIEILNNIIINIGKNNFNFLIPKLNIYLKIMYYILLILLYSFKKYKKTNLILIVLITILPIFKKYFYYSKLYFLDVGQGDSSVYISKDTTIVIDAFKSVSRLLLHEGIYVIDCLILTHNHMDHVNEASYLISNYKVNNIILNDYDDYNINSLKITYIDEYKIIKINEVTLEFLYLNNKLKGSNNNSLVFKMYYDDKSILFTGDIEYEAELLLYDIYKKRLKSDILKVAHHGSDTSSHYFLLEEVNPKISIISVGYDNKYMMPNENVLNNLMKIGTIVYRTDLNGTILYYNSEIHLI